MFFQGNGEVILLLFMYESRKLNIVMKTSKLIKSFVQYFRLFVNLYILKTINNAFGFILPLLLSFCSMCRISERQLCSCSNVHKPSLSCSHHKTDWHCLSWQMFTYVTEDVSTHQAFPAQQVQHGAKISLHVCVCVCVPKWKANFVQPFPHLGKPSAGSCSAALILILLSSDQGPGPKSPFFSLSFSFWL